MFIKARRKSTKEKLDTEKPIAAQGQVVKKIVSKKPDNSPRPQFVFDLNDTQQMRIGEISYPPSEKYPIPKVMFEFRQYYKTKGEWVYGKGVTISPEKAQELLQALKRWI